MNVDSCGHEESKVRDKQRGLTLQFNRLTSRVQANFRLAPPLAAGSLVTETTPRRDTQFAVVDELSPRHYFFEARGVGVKMAMFEGFCAILAGR